jgi:membrane associated rhomboid family serine protease
MTWVLLFTLAACYLAQWLLEGLKGAEWVYSRLALSREGLTHGWVYQLLTFQFMHAGIMHLLMNMIGLYFFGRAIENALGSLGVLKLYLAGGVVGGLLQVGLAFLFRRHFDVPVVGASAGVFALIAAFATRSPEVPITLLVFFVLPVSFKARALLIIEAAIALAGIASPIFGGNIANGAHLGGMLTGMVWIWRGSARGGSFAFWRRRQPRRADCAKNLG